MYKQYGDDVQFFFVYCREAHAIDSDRPIGKEIEQPNSNDERRQVAMSFLKEVNLEIPSLLDNIDDKTSRDYASLPDRLFLIGVDGKIAYAGEKGPRGFRPNQLKEAIERELAKPKSKSTLSEQTGRLVPRQ